MRTQLVDGLFADLLQVVRFLRAGMQRKQYGVVLRNELTGRVYRNFGAFPSAGLNHCFGNKKNKIFSLFCQSIPAKDVW